MPCIAKASWWPTLVPRGITLHQGAHRSKSLEVGGEARAKCNLSWVLVRVRASIRWSSLVERETTKFDDWSLELGPHLTSVEIQRVRAFICSYHGCFICSLQDSEGYKIKPIHIQLEDDHPIFGRPYRINVAKRIGIQVCCRELLATRLIKLSNMEYACATVMPSNKDIFGNWTEKWMCGDYCLINQKTKSDRYPMPTSEELFDALGFAWVLSTLGYRFGYHQLPFCGRSREDCIMGCWSSGEISTDISGRSMCRDFVLSWAW